MKAKRYKWLSDGRPRSNVQSYLDYKAAKCDFRRHHRQCVQTFLVEEDNELDKCAEMNRNHFWRIVNKKRKGSGTQAGSELKFGDTVVRDAQPITHQWQNYFETLYSPSDNND